MTYFAGLKTIDFIVEGLDRSKGSFIVTTKPDAVCSELSKSFECGITILDAKGYYSKSEKTMVYLVLNRFQIGRMKEIVHTVDPMAYISIMEIADVFRVNQQADNDDLIEEKKN